MDDYLLDDGWSDSDWEGDEAEAIDALPDPSPSSRLVTVSACFLIFAIGLGVIPFNSLVGLLPREEVSEVLKPISRLVQNLAYLFSRCAGPVLLGQLQSDPNTFERMFWKYK